MMNRAALHLAVLTFCFAVLGPAPVFAAEAGEQKIAVVDLDYLDTSGELGDQSKFHAHLVSGFSEALSRDLEASGKFKSVALRCGNSACSSHDAPSDLQKAAEGAGVRFVVLGGFHKMSTLVQWAKIEILDATTGHIVFDRLVTFRNDTEEAWQRAEAFVAREILAANIVADQRTVDPPIKLAVFDFELLDFSGGAGLVPESADDRAQLQHATEDVRRLLAQSGHYTLVDVSGVTDPAAKNHELLKCDGCEAAIAKRLGADEAFLGIVTRITRTDYAVTYKLRDAATGKILDVEQSDLRIGANYSWNRGAAALVKDKLLNNSAELGHSVALPKRPARS